MRSFMTQTSLRALCAGAAFSLPLAAQAATDAAATVPGNVASWVAGATRTGSPDAGQRVSILVHMKLKDGAGLAQIARDVSTVGGPRYGQYLTAQQLLSRFAPDAADVAAVRAMLVRGGMEDVTVGPGGVYVSAIATVGQLRGTFGVSQDLYRHGTRTLRANRQAPVLPAALAGKIVFIEGLDDTNLKSPQHHVAVRDVPLAAPALRAGDDKPAHTPPPVASQAPYSYCNTYYGALKATLSTKPNPYAQNEPWVACGYTPQQIQLAYGFNQVTQTGKGVTVAITDAYASPTIKADVNQYSAAHNLPLLTTETFSQTAPAGILNVDPAEPCGPYGWWGEETLDVTAVHGTAPDATIFYVGARDCGSSLTAALENTIYNHQADIITNSYSFNGEADDPADIVAQDQAFMAASAEGISVLFSTGDDGDLSQVNGVATGSFSSTSPWVTAVGGTSLALYDSSGTKNEWGWGTYRDYLNAALVNSGTSITTSGLQQVSNFGITYNNFAYYSGAGGGISLIEAQPFYQAGVVPDTLATTLHYANGYGVVLATKQRVAPDVAMDADPYTGYKVGESYTIAGDSTNDHGCTPTGATTEYCELTYGGTSLSSPLLAGALAVVNQARLAGGRPVVGFANPWFYSHPIGKTLKGMGINDVKPPEGAKAVLRGYMTDPTRVRLVTMNSVSQLYTLTPFPIFTCSTYICEGINDVFNYTTPAYDTVTGLGAPWLPKLVAQ